MSEAPFYYDFINQRMAAHRPGTVHANDTGLAKEFERMLLQRAMSPFKFTFPETWAENYVLYTLYINGYFTVFSTSDYGVIPQHCGLYGLNVFYQPREVVVANPVLSGIKNLTIGKDCTLVKLQPDYMGVGETVAMYADLLAVTAEAFGLNVFNSKLAYLFATDSKTASEAFKATIDMVMGGQPAVVTDPKLFGPDGKPRWTEFAQDLRSNFIAPDLLETFRSLMQMFDEAVGLPNANTGKRERMVTDEVNVNNFSTRSKCEIWLEQLQKGFKQTRDMFNIPESELNVEWREGARGDVGINNQSSELPADAI